MNEIDKLYENFNIKPKQKGYCDMLGAFCPYPHHECNDKCPCWKYEDEAKYPPFTAEKQLELIKWLSDISSYFSVHYDRYKGTYNVQTGDGGLYVTNNLSEAIASRINIIWNDLSKKQRTQIKEILE